MVKTQILTIPLPGILSGAAGLLIFLVFHALWIRPIWFIFPAGLVVACLGGLAVSWSYAEIKAGLPPRPWTSLAVFALVSLTLVPAILIAQLRPPLVDITTGSIMPGSIAGIVTHFVIELLFTAALVGGLAGWWLGRTKRAAFATALAGLIFALGPGHNIPFLGNTPAAGKGMLLLVVIILVSAVVLVETDARLTR